jgi:hypothetical protein
MSPEFMQRRRAMATSVGGVRAADRKLARKITEPVKDTGLLRQDEMSAATINQSDAEPALHGGAPSAHGRQGAVQTPCRL